MTKMLFIDIETAPILGHVWSLWKQNVGLNQIKEDWYIMSFCAKWAGEDEIIYEDGRDTPEDDYSMLLTLHKLLDQADYVVAHNGDRFDIKKIKARMILNGISPPSPFKSIDTLKIVKKEFAFTSNKLAYLTDKLCTTKKLDHAKYAGFTLWTECLRGNDDAWEEMREYNIVDVTSLEELYEILRPWSSMHPNINAQSDDETMLCPKCGSDHIVKRGFFHTNKGKFQRYHCHTCHGWSSTTTTMNTKEKRASLLQSR
jgi:uncharacterized protein YprB with RNaseH-like and TPR domain